MPQPVRPSIRPSVRPGPGSPVSPLKELAQRVRRQQQALEACVQELRRLCLREAVSGVQGGSGGGPDTHPTTPPDTAQRPRAVPRS